METLGYRNAQKVMRLSAEGKFLTMFRGNPTPNMTAYAMMLTMAEITYDWPPTEENQRKGLPSRVYERGWGILQNSSAWESSAMRPYSAKITDD